MFNIKTLLFVRIKYATTVLWTYVVTLPIQLGRIVNGKENLEKYSLRNNLWIECNFDYLCMPCAFSANLLIGWVIDVTT